MDKKKGRLLVTAVRATPEGAWLRKVLDRLEGPGWQDLTPASPGEPPPSVVCAKLVLRPEAVGGGDALWVRYVLVGSPPEQHYRRTGDALFLPMLPESFPAAPLDDRGGGYHLRPPWDLGDIFDERERGEEEEEDDPGNDLGGNDDADFDEDDAPKATVGAVPAPPPSLPPSPPPSLPAPEATSTRVWAGDEAVLPEWLSLSEVGKLTRRGVNYVTDCVTERVLPVTMQVDAYGRKQPMVAADDYRVYARAHRYEPDEPGHAVKERALRRARKAQREAKLGSVVAP